MKKHPFALHTASSPPAANSAQMYIESIAKTDAGRRRAKPGQHLDAGAT